MTKLFLLLALAGSIYFASNLTLGKNIEASLYNGLDFDQEPAPAEPETAPDRTKSFVKIPIFIYHSVRPYIVGESKIQDLYDITPDLFERQLAYLKENNYTTVTLNDLVKDIRIGTTSPVSKPVILTFDDGWENQYKYAFPLLKKYKMIATFYVFTNPIGKKRHFLTWDQIKEMDAAGMTIASHSLSHPYLKNLPPDSLRRELSESKKILEAELGKPVLHFASPFGYTSPLVVDEIKNAGYLTGRTTYKGIYHTENNLYKLTGFLINDNFNDFVTILNK